MHRRSFWPAATLTCLALVGAPGLARADATGQDAARAQALFEDGKRLMSASKYDEACDKFAESQRLDAGGGTLLALALCHEGQGKTATAWSDFNLVLTQARRDGRTEREQAAQEHIALLTAKLTKLSVRVTAQADVTVTCDGTALGKAEWGTPEPVDPGTHTVTASAPGKKTWRTTVEARGEGTTVTVNVPLLEPGAPEAGAAAAPAPAVAPEPGPPTASGAGPWRPAGLVMGAVGVVGLGVGSAFGLAAMSRRSDAQSAGCVGNVCPADAASKRDEARNAANLSTVFFVAGGVLAAGGVTLWLLAPRPTRTPAVGLYVDGGAAGMRGTW
jgi:hypothetical protein